MILRYILSFLLLTCNMLLTCSSQQTSSVDINLLASTDEEYKILDRFLPDSFYLEKSSFKADVIMYNHELESLADFKEKSWVTRDAIKRFCWHLKRKSKFESLVITKVQGPTGIILTFELKAAWTFTKLKFKGSLLGKDRYQQYYSLEPGEIFDLNKHRHAVNTLVQELKNNGYLAVSITDSVSYDKDTKSVTVTLQLDNTDSFVISGATVYVKIHEKNESQESKQLENKIKKFVDRELSNNYYSKTLIEQQVQNIKTYLARKGFLNPKVEITTHVDQAKKMVAILFTVTLDHKKRFIFSGNQFFTSEQLLDELLIIDTSAILVPPALLADDIKELYKKKGFWSATIEWREEPERYFFTIEEGPRSTIAQILIKSGLEKERENRVKKYFNDFLKSNYFDDDLLQQSIDNALLALKQDGYWDATFKDQESVPDAHKTINCTLVLTLDMGERRMLSKVSIKNFPAVLKESPFAQLATLEKAIPFDISLLEEQKHWLLKYFQQKGYIYVRVKPELVTHAQGIELVWHIITNTNAVTFGKTVVTGTSRVSPDIVLRELQYKEGEPWDKNKIEQTLKRLKALNIFESVSLKPYNIAQAENTKTLMLKCAEDDPFEIRTRLGFQQVSKSFTNLSGTTYIVGGSFLWKNPSGLADLLRVDADITRYSRNFIIGYELPWLGNQPIRTISKLYSTRYQQPLIAHSHDRLYKEAHDGLAVTFLPSYWQAQSSFTVGFEWNKLSDISDQLAKAINFEHELINKRIPTFYIEPSCIINKLDNPVNPTKGFFTLLSAKGVFPLGVKSGHYIKVLFEQSAVYPVYGSVIGALRFRFGHIFNAKFSTIMPTERFYLGGAYSLRGYEPDMVPPLNAFTTCNGQVGWAPVGGKSMVNINAELRFPLYKNVGGVIFNDMGVLAQDKLTDIVGNKWVGATGVGLRYDTPIGPLRFDIGWKWKKRTPEDKSFAWFLTLGHAF